MIKGDRKPEEFEDDRKKWKIYFDLEVDKSFGRNESSVLVKFSKFREEKFDDLDEKNIEKLKQDLKDLGKFRIIKQGKDFLEK